MKGLAITSALLLCTALTTRASEQPEPLDAFVESNLIGIFYHELGHAVIDIAQVPIYAQEEDAADVFSIFLIDELYEEETARQLAIDAALGFLGEAELRVAAGDEIAWWDEHGIDEQRFYNTLCIFIGADPDGRESLAQEFELPDDRAEQCPAEYDAAATSWGVIIDELSSDTFSSKITVDFDSQGNAIAELLSAEIAELNKDFSFPEQLTVVVEACGEPNAFYEADTRRIVMCKEFVPHLQEVAAEMMD